MDKLTKLFYLMSSLFLVLGREIVEGRITAARRRESTQLLSTFSPGFPISQDIAKRFIRNKEIKGRVRKPKKKSSHLKGRDPGNGDTARDDPQDVDEAYQSRLRRYAYEDTHVWKPGDNQDYDLEEKVQGPEQLNTWQKIGRNWQGSIIRGIFMLTGVIMVLLVCFCCCTVWCRVCCHSMKKSCIPCDECLNNMSWCYQDPMYAKARDLAGLFGLKLDYATYMKIKDRVALEGSGAFAPIG